MMTESEDSPEEGGIPKYLVDEDFALALWLQTSDAFEDSFDPSDDVRSGILSPETPRFGSTLPSSVLAQPTSGLSPVDPQLEIIDPNPDIHALFLEFNERFFWGRLSGIEVKWSPRMTLCAGVCSYEGRGGLCSVRLSLPLLKLRPRKDLVETLLHEMIHAYLFVTANNRDREGHGPEFLKHMNRINRETGAAISVYHNFHDEVEVYRQHWWRCDGVCRQQKPFFGYVKRSMNRAPGPNDTWWSNHAASCGGRFVKVKEPANYGKKTKDSNNKQKSDTPSTAVGFKGKGKGKNNRNSGTTSTPATPALNGAGSNGVDIRTLFAQQDQRLKQLNGDEVRRNDGGGEVVGERGTYPSLVDKENFKNAAFSGFGHKFTQGVASVPPIESKPWLRRFDGLNSDDNRNAAARPVIEMTTTASSISATTKPTATATDEMNASPFPGARPPGVAESTPAADDDVEDEDDLMDFMASVMDENNASNNNTLSRTGSVEVGESRPSDNQNPFGAVPGGGGGTGGHQRQDRTVPSVLPDSIPILEVEEKLSSIPTEASLPTPLFGAARATRSAGPRMSTPSRWDPSHDILSDSDSDDERLFAKLDASVERRRRVKRLKRSHSLDGSRDGGRGRGDEGSRSRSPRARVTAPPSVGGAIPKKSWATKKRDPALRAVPIRSRSVENSPKAKRSRTHSPSSTGEASSSRVGTGPRPSTSRDSSGLIGHSSGRRSFDTDALHSFGGNRHKKRPFGGSAAASFHHSLSTEPDPLTASSPRAPGQGGRDPSSSRFFFNDDRLEGAANLAATSRLSNSAPDVNNVASAHEARSTASSGRDGAPICAGANFNGNFADDEEAALREAIRLSQLHIKDNQTPTASDDDDEDVEDQAAAAAPPSRHQPAPSFSKARHRIHSASSGAGGVFAPAGSSRPFSWASTPGAAGAFGVASTSRGGSSMVQLPAGSVASTSRGGSSMVQLPVFSPIGEAEVAHVACPVCGRHVKQSQINAHLDMCLK